MKPDILSKRRLKKIEETLQVEKNKLELAQVNRARELGDKDVKGDPHYEKWDKELDDLTSRLRSLREKKGEESDTIFKDELVQRDKRIQGLEKELSKKADEINSLNKDLNDLKESNLNLDAELKDSINENKVLSRRIAEFDKILGKKGKDLLDSEKKIQKITKRFEDREADLMGEIQARRDEVRTLKLELKNLMDDSKELQKKNRLEVGSLEDRLNRSIEEREKLRIDLSNTKKALSDYGSQLNKLTKDVREKDMLVSSKDQEIMAIRERLESWHSSISAELDSAIEFITEQADEIKALRAALDAREAGSRENKGLLYQG